MARSHRALGLKVRKRTPLESSIEGKSTKYAVGCGCLHYRMNGLGNRGKDDHIYVLPNGWVLWCEFKRPKKEPRRNQELQHAELKARYQLHAVPPSFDEFKGVLDKALTFRARKVPSTW